MATAGDQISRALRLLGVLAEGESPSADTANDALTALNQMIDSWSIERLSVYSTQDQTFTWPANEVVQTLGPSGDFVGNRPVLLSDSSYFVVNGVSYGIKLVNEEEYNSIAVKSVTSTMPQVMYVNMTYPDVAMRVYPVPTQAIELYFPPGYLRAFTYNLACEIAPEFGEEPSPGVQRIAMTSKRNLKRVNNPDDVMSIPYAMVSSRRRFNVYSGNY